MKRKNDIIMLYNILDKFLLPHIDIDNLTIEMSRKCYFIGYIVNKLLKLFTKQIQSTDRDSFL